MNLKYVKGEKMPFIDFNKRKIVKIWDGITGPLYHSENITSGHFTLDEGIVLPEHSHPHEQWSHVIEGKLEFNINGDIKILEAGMTALILPNIPHSGKAITKCIVIDCFLPVREDFKDLEKNQT
ncbi:MAG: cupin domain-containing protein [bacterium]